MDQKELEGFRTHLVSEERSAATVEKYLYEAGAFVRWLGERSLDKQAALAYKEELLRAYAAASVNCKLAAVNRFLKFLGRADCAVRAVKTQRRLFRAKERELTKAEYLRLVAAAGRKGDRRLRLILQAICSTGIRVSELRYITAEAVKTGRAEVRCKGKERTIFLPKLLCRQLLGYLRERGISSGPVFVTRSGRNLDRGNIWAAMKGLCRTAGVAASKVFPHNLRHLFARLFYRQEKDIARLADILGHSSVETTRIYMVSTGAEHAQRMERLGLVI